MALFEPIHSIQEQAKDIGLALIAESPTIKKDIEDNLAATNNAVKTTINSMRLDIANTASDIIEGVENKDARIFSVQYHPESAPGPQDSSYLFDEFIDLMHESH